MPVSSRRALVLTALRVEYAAVRAHLENLTETEHDEGDVYERGQFQMGAQAWEVGIVEMGAGNPNAAQKTERAIGYFKPEVVLFVGVAGGLKDVKLGDVVVATKVYGYHSGKAEDDFRTRPEVGLPNHRILERARAESRKDDWFKCLQLPGDKPKPRVFLGAIAAGEQVVVSMASNSYQLIRKSYGDALAVEMESYGFFSAVHANTGLEALAVRGISDLITDKTEADVGGSQESASRHAAAFAFEVLANLKLPDNPSPPKRGEVVRSTLPAQPYFFGRQKELESIAEAIAPDSRTWGALIDGPGGIGKTALALRSGHLASSQQFPLKLFLSAKVRELTPSGEQPLTDSMLPGFQELLKELVRELGEEGINQVEPDERTKFVRSALSNRQALLVIDNVETLPELERVRLYQFLAFLPICCKAIVTSRRRSDIDARQIRLDRLALNDALDFMEELARNNPYLQKAEAAECRQLYEHTNGNPLLIRWVVGQLGRPKSQCRTIKEACAFLNQAPTGNDPLEYIFGDLLDTFTGNESAVLAAMAHFNGPAKLQWLAELADLASPAALTALEDLSYRSLLIPGVQNDTYFLPCYTSTYLRRKRPELVAKTGERLADRAYALAVENGYQKYDHFQLLETEWPSIAAALPSLLQGGNDRLQTVCDALLHFLILSGRWEDALKLYSEAEEIALVANDFHRAGCRADDIAWFHYQLREVDKLLTDAERCEAHWLQSGFNAEEKAKVLRIRGRHFELKRDYPAAKLAFADSIPLWRSLDPDSRYVSIALTHLARVEQTQGDLSAAEGHLREALRIENKNQDPEMIAGVNGWLAELALTRKQWLKAEQLAKAAFDGSELIQRLDYIATNSRRLAVALFHQHHREEGLPYAQRAVEILTRLRMPDELEKAQEAVLACSGEDEPVGS